MSIRTETEKYIFHMKDSDEFYDLIEDPWEMKNLALSPATEPKVQKLRDRLLQEVRGDVPRLAEIMERAIAEQVEPRDQ